MSVVLFSGMSTEATLDAIENKRGRLCVCGRRKYAKTPFCSLDWRRVPEDLKAESKASSDETYPAVFAKIVAYLKEHPAPVEETPAAPKEQTPEQEGATKGLIMIGLSEAQLDRVWAGASLDMKIAAMRGMLALDVAERG